MTMEAKLVKILIDKKMTISTAESCTGGMIASRIVSISGASDVLKICFVTYANEAKEKYLGVSKDSIDKHTVVSEQVAREMAEGLRKETGCDIAIATTGIAGPGGGTKENPVGTVYIGISIKEHTVVKRFVFHGNREEVRIKATDKAIQMATEMI